MSCIDFPQKENWTFTNNTTSCSSCWSDLVTTTGSCAWHEREEKVSEDRFIQQKTTLPSNTFSKYGTNMPYRGNGPTWETAARTTPVLVLVAGGLKSAAEAHISSLTVSLRGSYGCSRCHQMPVQQGALSCPLATQGHPVAHCCHPGQNNPRAVSMKMTLLNPNLTSWERLTMQQSPWVLLWVLHCGAVDQVLQNCLAEV